MMGDGALKEKMMQKLSMPLTEQEEAVLSMMKRINELEYENLELREEITRLKWLLTTEQIDA